MFGILLRMFTALKFVISAIALYKKATRPEYEFTRKQSKKLCTLLTTLYTMPELKALCEEYEVDPEGSSAGMVKALANSGKLKLIITSTAQADLLN